MTASACLYCEKGQRLSDAMIEICALEVSTLYLFREQTYPGRCVVAYSKDHEGELFELSEADRNSFISDVARAAKAVKAAVHAGKINYGAYGDKTPHLHFHIVPKWEDGPDWGGTFEMLPSQKIFPSNDGYAETIAMIKAQL